MNELRAGEIPKQMLRVPPLAYTLNPASKRTLYATAKQMQTNVECRNTAIERIQNVIELQLGHLRLFSTFTPHTGHVRC